VTKVYFAEALATSGFGFDQLLGIETATVTHQNFPPGVLVFDAVGVEFKGQITRCAKG
jgi:hypothetical protein